MATFADQRLLQASSFQSALRFGRATDRSLAQVLTAGGVVPPDQTGVPTIPMCFMMLNSPDAADADYFVAAVLTGTSAKTYTLANTTPPGEAFVDGLSHVVARNVTVTVDGAKTTTITVVGFDIQGRAQTEAISVAASGAGLTSGSVCFSKITSISSSASAGDVTITVGYGNKFGLPYPLNVAFPTLCDVLYNSAATAWPNTRMTTVNAQVALNPAELRVWDAYATNLPVAAAADDLGFTGGGTFGSAPSAIRTIDFKAASTTAYFRWIIQLPSDYIPGGTLTLRLNAGMNTTVSDGTCTVDASAYLDNGGSDLVTTAAQSINSLTAANKDFTITPTGLVPGSTLDVRVVVAGTDAATVTAVIGQINLTGSGLFYQSVAGGQSTYVTWTTGATNGAVANNSDRFGSVQIGGSDTSSGTLVPDGTRSYAVVFPCVYPQGVDGTDNIGLGTNEAYTWPY